MIRLAALLLCAPLVHAQITAPNQPASGPGGSNYPHASLRARGPFWPAGQQGNDDLRYFLYEPAAPVPAAAPVILFLHGYFVNDPVPYAGWLAHMTRKGYVVVWVQFDKGFSGPATFAGNAITAYRDALSRMDSPGFVNPLRDAQGRILSAVTGHSLGGLLSNVVAALAADPANGIPAPKSIVAVEPADSRFQPPVDYSRIDAETKVVFVIGENDALVCDSGARQLWPLLSQVRAANRDYLAVQSDLRGTPAQAANHLFPLTLKLFDTAAIDARDFYVTWKLSVAGADCGIFGRNCEYAIGKGSPEQTGMGNWSDGSSVNPMRLVADPQTYVPACRVP